MIFLAYWTLAVMVTCLPKIPIGTNWLVAGVDFSSNRQTFKIPEQKLNELEL